MPTLEELKPLLSEPREDLAFEYKNWLDLTNNEHKAVLAKAAIALANHGGGFIILGFSDNRTSLEPIARPDSSPEISQDAVNAAIQRFATPAFHCELHNVPHPISQIPYPIIVVPGGRTEPVMSKRDCGRTLSQNRCYIRRPGPSSEEPQTTEEWRNLLRRCVLAGREDMLEAIRSIVSGQIDPTELPENAQEALREFCNAAHVRWDELIQSLPDESPARFPQGYYELGFSFVGATAAPNLTKLKARIENAHRIKLTGWPTFLTMHTPEWAPYSHEEFIEAWIGKPTSTERSLRDPAHADFWRISLDGKLYSIRGYSEDSLERLTPGSAIDVTLPVWRIGEGLLFAARLAEEFDDVQAIAIACKFTGLNDRFLTSVSGNRALFDDRFIRTPEVQLQGQATLSQIRDNLDEVMYQLLVPLYERFDFFELPQELVNTELAKLRGGRF